MEEVELVQAASQGDLTAFNELVLKYQDQVFNLAHRILGNQDLAEDATQNTFIHAFQKFHQFRGGSFRAWLLKIATNLCYDEMRIWKRHPHQPLEPTDEEKLYWLKDLGPLPEEEAEMSDLRNVLEHRLNQLPLKFRTVVILVDGHQLEYQEASRITGIPIGTVKSRLVCGRMQLGSYLKSCSSELNIFNVAINKPTYQSK